MRRLGCTHYGKSRITISQRWLAFPSTTRRDAENTVLHELAHALAGPKAGHGPEWKAQAQALGCDAERCAPALDETYHFHWGDAGASKFLGVFQRQGASDSMEEAVVSVKLDNTPCATQNKTPAPRKAPQAAESMACPTVPGLAGTGAFRSPPYVVRCRDSNCWALPRYRRLKGGRTGLLRDRRGRKLQCLHCGGPCDLVTTERFLKERRSLLAPRAKDARGVHRGPATNS